MFRPCSGWATRRRLAPPKPAQALEKNRSAGQAKPSPTVLKNTDDLPEQQVVWICGGTKMK
jgi:hypothetical protein